MVSTFIESESHRTIIAEQGLQCAASPELDRLANLAADLLQVRQVAITACDGEGQTIVAGAGLDVASKMAVEALLSRSAAGALSGSCQIGAEKGGRRETETLRFFEAVPLKGGSTILGYLAIGDKDPRRLSARGKALLEKLAEIVVDELFLCSLARHLDLLARERMKANQVLQKQKTELAHRLSIISRLGRIAGWALDVESEQILWTDDLPDSLTLRKEALADRVVALYARPSREQIRRALRRATDYGEPLEVEHPVRLGNGETRWLRLVGEFNPGADGSDRVVGIVQDVSERYRAEEKIQYLSHCDPVTSLPNRPMFQDRLQAATRWAKQAGAQSAVLVLDIDRFSEINAALGYARGDAALASLAERLSSVIRGCDTLARLGDDRFGIIMGPVDAASDVMKMAERLLLAVSETSVIDHPELRPSASIGIAVFPTDGSDGPQILQSAETALASAKQRGGGSYAFFRQDMATAVEHRRRLMADVRSALAADQFAVVYQPKVDFRSGQIAGFEALIRWLHPDRGTLPPAAFWDALQDPLLGRQLSDAVLHKVACQLSSWRQCGVQVASVSVNVTASQLRDPEFLERLSQLLSSRGLPPNSLRLEITEGVLLGRRSDQEVRLLNGIQEIGIDTELDDFGTGYASLTHLRQLPVSRLKIDRSFVTNLTADPRNDAIVRAVIGMAHALRMEVVAEGVETPEVDQRLRELACDYGQGFLYAHPMAPDEVSNFLRRWNGGAASEPQLRVVC